MHRPALHEPAEVCDRTRAPLHQHRYSRRCPENRDSGLLALQSPGPRSGHRALHPRTHQRGQGFRRSPFEARKHRCRVAGDHHRLRRSVGDEPRAVRCEVARGHLRQPRRTRAEQAVDVLASQAPVAVRFPRCKVVCLPFHRFHAAQPAGLQRLARPVHLYLGNVAVSHPAQFIPDRPGRIHRALRPRRGVQHKDAELVEREMVRGDR